MTGYYIAGIQALSNMSYYSLHMHNAIFVSRKGAKINFEFKRFKTIDNSQWVFLVSKDVIYHILSIFECAMKIGNFFPSLIFYKFLKNENVG